jgi:putative ABC transport system permease protein
MLYLGLFAGVGLFLSAVGLYGVLAYSVARRTREIGIRMALGAQIDDVIRLILNQGLVLVALGGAMGMAAALATGRLLRAFLFGVSSTDPVAFVGVALLLATVSLFACWLPARRAAKVDPMEALRNE